MKKLYLDDVRCPKTEGWDIVRTYDDFVSWITKNGLPYEVSFDHDLAEIHYDPKTYTENGLPLPEFNCHSANPVGRENILAILNSHKERLNY